MSIVGLLLVGVDLIEILWMLGLLLLLLLVLLLLLLLLLLMGVNGTSDNVCGIKVNLLGEFLSNLIIIDIKSLVGG